MSTLTKRGVQGKKGKRSSGPRAVSGKHAKTVVLHARAVSRIAAAQERKRLLEEAAEEQELVKMATCC